ncbi:hypothetical protein [Archangium violaceum]|uniref:hypothetical protein n=1 Tax=Archangium violaceum TaxID=83451 RepID=UPI0036DA6B78
MRLYVGLWWMCSWLLACASSQNVTGETQNYGLKGNWVWVRGPWDQVEPSRDVDEVIDQLCPAIMRLPLVQQGEYGQEYCGALYLLDGSYYASHPSPLGAMVRVAGRERRQCKPPRYVEDSRGQPTPLADFHSHPWGNSPMSQQDRRGPNQLWSIRIQFDTRCRVMKLIPYLAEERPGELYERQGKLWKLIGIIKPEDKESGIVTAIDG